MYSHHDYIKQDKPTSFVSSILEKKALKNLTKVAGSKVSYKVVNFRLSRNTERIYEMLHPEMVQSLILSGKEVVEYFLFPFVYDIISKNVCTNAQKKKFKNQLDNDLSECRKIYKRNIGMANFEGEIAQAGIHYFELYYKAVIEKAEANAK
jgi:hypothetical protein